MEMSSEFFSFLGGLEEHLLLLAILALFIMGLFLMKFQHGKQSSDHKLIDGIIAVVLVVFLVTYGFIVKGKTQLGQKGEEKLNELKNNAKKLESQGRYGEAYEKYIEITLLEPDYKNWLKKAGLAKINGDMSNALSAYKESEGLIIAMLDSNKEDLNLKSSLFEVYHNVAEIFEIKEEVDSALEEYKKAKDVFGGIIKLNGELENYQKLVKLNHKIGDLYFLRGELNNTSKWYKEALSVAVIAKEKNEGYSGEMGLAESHIKLARFFKWQNKDLKAIDHYDEAIEVAKNMEEIMQNKIDLGYVGNFLAACYSEKASIAEKQSGFNDSLEYYKLALVKQKEAIRYASNELKYSHNFFLHANNLAATEVKQGNFYQAEEILKDSKKI